MTHRSEIPGFGSLEGLKVVYSGSILAGPFAAQMMADFGADVIWIENPRSHDALRTEVCFEQERRNQRNIGLNMVAPEGREVLARLVTQADIFIESSRGGQFQRWRLPDELLWEWNPALVIVHISGYGQDGVPEYVGRPAFDSVAQAFSCYLHQNGYPDRPPVPAFPFAGDYFAALFAWGAALAALYRAQKTGQGESIDCAQFEVLLRVQGWHLLDYLNNGVTWQRSGSVKNGWVCDGVFECAGGDYVYVQLYGAPSHKALIEFLGFEYGSPEFPEGAVVLGWDSTGGPKLHDALAEYCRKTDALEIDQTLNAVGVPCSVVMDYRTACVNPHYAARHVFTDWQTARGERFKGVSVVPKQKRNPGRIWRGAPSVGMDNDDILSDLGFSSAKIEELYASGAIRREEGSARG